jgi:threonine/homoserine/homoserine lactone efflux protein
VLLGVRRVLDRGGSLGAADAGAAPAAPRSILRQGFLVAALNPKTALFFLAFLPQFADPARASMAAQVLALGLLFVALAVVTDSGYVLVAGGLGAWLRRNPAFARRERYLSGAIYVGLGALSALAR